MEPKTSVTEKSGQPKRKGEKVKKRKVFMLARQGLGGDSNEEETKRIKNYRVERIWEYDVGRGE